MMPPRKYTVVESTIGLLGFVILVCATLVDHPWGAFLAFWGTTLMSAVVIVEDRRTGR